MKKQKISLSDLRLESFVTSNIRGGLKRIADDTTVPPSSDCEPTEASYTCPGAIQNV
ncbi:hypothetical protein AB9P05_07725 [Roseivirga sp. BDSF3-8]|uniref:hypothetical protein n=1 Tax=Roseivirga sp. BDSF3-8 TaxID=3241598 RepID=UPI0035318FB8